MNIVFSSKAPKQYRQALEDMLFFNPHQAGVREGIIKSLSKFGHPRLVETGDTLAVRIGDLDAQTLFAFDQGRLANELAGVVIFLRTSNSEMAVMHMAVNPDYGLQGKHGGMGLGIVLMEKVKEICTRIVGIERIVLSYRNDIAIRLKGSQ